MSLVLLINERKSQALKIMCLKVVLSRFHDFDDYKRSLVSSINLPGLYSSWFCAGLGHCPSCSSFDFSYLSGKYTRQQHEQNNETGS